MTSTQTSLSEFGIPEARDDPLFVDGAWAEALSGEWMDVTSPIRRGKVIGRVPASGAADADRAVRAARKAFPQ